MLHFMQKALLVFEVSQVPELDRAVNRCRGQEPITAGIELCMGHFGFVQLVVKDLHRNGKVM